MSREPALCPRVAWLLLTTLLLALSACERTDVLPAPTQITLQISSDEVVRGALVQLRVSVALREGASAWRTPTTATMSADKLLWPVAIPVTPRNEAEASSQFEVVVEARGAGDLVLAETRAIAAFERGRHKVLPLALFRCPGHDQEPGFRCAMAGCQGEACRVCDARGDCVPVSIFNPNDLPPGPGDHPDAGGDDDASFTPGEAGAGGDAAALDGATSDANVTASDGGVPLDALPGLDSTTPAEEAGVSDASQLDAMAQDASGDSSADAGRDAALDAGNDASTACQTNFKRCGASCIPVAQCCMNDECPAGSMCRQGSCKYWCDEQTRPLDVLAADYQCLDFEKGLPSAAIWARSTTDAAKLAASTSRAFSTPASLATVPNGTLSWSFTGPTPVKSILFEAAVSPLAHPTVTPEPPYAKLVCLTIGQSNAILEQCLSYVFKGKVFASNGTIENYTGLFLQTFIINGAALQLEEPLYVSGTTTPLNFQANVWNALSMKVDTNVRVTVGSQSASIAGGVGADTNGSVSLGATGDVSVFYDNVQVSVRR